MLRIPSYLGVSLSFLLAAAPAVADDYPALVAAAFGNTIVSTYPDGRTAQLWLQPGGDYTATGRYHEPTNGHWWVKEGRLCLKQAHPFAFGFVYCTALAQFTTGSTWISKAVTGETIHISLVRGKPGEAPG